jgi:Bacterial toxin 46
MNDLTTELLKRLGLPAAPVVIQGIETTASFFAQWLQTDPLLWLDYLRGMDFHKVVRVTTLDQGAVLARFVVPGSANAKPFAYFTKPGESNARLGTNFPSYQFQLWKCLASIKSLESRASGIKFTLSDPVSRLGGGIQFIIASRDLRNLEALPPHPK